VCVTIMSDVAWNIQQVRDRIQQICKRDGLSQPVRLVAVSKTKPNQLIEDALSVGQLHFGENYVQELVAKAPELSDKIKWHFIGHLQSNKVKNLLNNVPNLFVIESVDSVKLATEINKNCAKLLAPNGRWLELGRGKLNVMVQVNTSGELSKSGVEPNDCVKLAEHIHRNCPALNLFGLMTIGKADDSSATSFKVLSACKLAVAEALSPEVTADSLELSMGMSGDFELAISNGSTNVRVGSTIFGARAYAASKPVEGPPSTSMPSIFAPARADLSSTLSKLSTDETAGDHNQSSATATATATTTGNT